MKCIFQLRLSERLPSWNQILGMQHWTRKKFKDNLAKDFLCGLKALESGSSTKITSAGNITLTYSDTLESYLTTRQIKSKLKSAKKNQAKAKLKKL